MKKQLLAGLAVTILVALGAGSPAHADLVVSGTVDYMGSARNLIYDTDLNITWLDYSNSFATWSEQQAWVSNLALTVNGVTYDNWRLPSTVDGPYVFSFDGTTSYGYNNTTSEMGHLYYTELGNKGAWDTNGNWQVDYSLNKTGPFANLVASVYWSGTEFAGDPNYAWQFGTNYGGQDVTSKDYNLAALAVLPGNIAAPVPEPASMLLISSGLACLIGLKRREK